MADWQERVQSMIIGFVFAYMVMKLFSVISNFRAGNMRVERASEEEEDSLLVPAGVPAGDGQAGALVGTDEETEGDGGDEQEEAHGESSSSSDSEAEDDAARTSRAREIGSADPATVSEVESKEADEMAKKDVDLGFKNKGGVEDVKMESEDVIKPGEESLKALNEEAGNDFEEEFEDEKEIDDWEGVESTELEKLFGAASTYAYSDAMVALPSVNHSSDAMLQLHAFYKIATEGPCSTSQPSAFQPTARAKWNAWQELGSMPQEEAMQKFIAVLTDINPTWYEDYRKSKERAAERKHGDLSQTSDKMDALPVLSELVRSGERGRADTVNQGSATC